MLNPSVLLSFFWGGGGWLYGLGILMEGVGVGWVWFHKFIIQIKSLRIMILEMKTWQ